MSESSLFVFGKSVPEENFIDREDETARMKSSFEEGINVILSSQRRMGKTSLVKHVMKLSDSQRVMVAYMDMFACRSAEDFYKVFLMSILRQTSNRLEEMMSEAKKFFSRISTNISVGTFSDPWNDVSMSFGLKPQVDDPSEILNITERIAKKKNRRIVVCIDEFQQVGDFPDSLRFQKILRGVWQHQEMTSYCLFGSKKHLMDALFLKKSYPFYKFGTIIGLGPIGKEHWLEYICDKFRLSSKEISEEFISRLYDAVDGIPSYIQELAWLIWMRTEKNSAVNEQIFEQALQDLADENNALFQSQTQELSSYQMNYLRAIKDGVHKGFTSKEIYTRYELGTPANVARIRKALLDKELIEVRDGEVFFADPIMRRWLI